MKLKLEPLDRIPVYVLLLALVVAASAFHYFWIYEAKAQRRLAAPTNLRIVAVLESIEKTVKAQEKATALDMRGVRALENIAGALTDLNNKFVKIAGDPWEEK